MKAIVTRKYRAADGLKLQEVERPERKDNDLLIQVHAATVTASDVMLRRLPFPVWAILRLFMGLKKKKTPGYEFSGVVKELLEAGEIRRLIDSVYPLEQTAEAHRYVETGRKRGNVVIVVADDSGNLSAVATSPDAVLLSQ